MAKIQILKDDLKKVLTVGGSCVIPDKTYPMSEYVRMTTKDDHLKVEATNSVTSIKVYTTLEVPTEELSFCIKHKDVLSYINAISDEDVTMDVDLENNYVKVVHTCGEYSIPCLDAKDFADFINAPKDTGMVLSLDGATLGGWLKRAKNFAAEDKLRPNINGAYLLKQGDTLSIAASDRTLLFYEECRDFDGREDFGIIIPASAFQAVSQAVEKEPEVTIITDGANKAWFKTGSAVLSTCLAVGKYPNVKSIIPAHSDIEVSVQKKQLLEALKRIGLSIDTGTSHAVRFTFKSNGTLDIAHENTIFSKAASETIVYDESSGIAFGILLGYDHLVKAVNALDGEHVKFLMNQPNKPILFKDDTNEDRLVLQMPMATIKKTA